MMGKPAGRWRESKRSLSLSIMNALSAPRLLWDLALRTRPILIMILCQLMQCFGPDEACRPAPRYAHIQTLHCVPCLLLKRVLSSPSYTSIEFEFRRLTFQDLAIRLVRVLRGKETSQAFRDLLPTLDFALQRWGIKAGVTDVISDHGMLFQSPFDSS